MRIKEYPNKTSVKLSDHQKQGLHAIADKRGQSVSDLIRYIIDLYLDKFLVEKKK